MPANAVLYSTTTVTNATIVTTAETIVGTIPSVAVDQYATIVRVDAMVNLTIGTGGDSVAFKVRRNTVTGTQLGSTVTYPVFEAGVYALEVSAIGSQPVGLHSYVITATVANASADSTVSAVVATLTVGN